MVSSGHSRLTPLQQDLLREFFAREKRLVLTGGGALAGFYFGHRDTEDLDLFGAPGVDLAAVSHAMQEAAKACGATTTPLQDYSEFKRLVAVRGDEQTVIDLVIDRVKPVDPDVPVFGEVRVHSLREIASNKVCTLLSRSEIKDLVDLRALVDAGVDLEQAFRDAHEKDGGADPGTVAWILEQLAIAPDARLPGGFDAAELDRFRRALIPRLRALAFEYTRRS